MAPDLKEARRHVRVAARADKRQLEEGRFLHQEHPWSESSWKEPETAELAADPRCYVVRGAICASGMVDGEDDGNPGHTRRHTGWLTNSRAIAAVLSKARPGGHRHVRSMGGERTKLECTRRSWSRQHFGRSPRSCDVQWLAAGREGCARSELD